MEMELSGIPGLTDMELTTIGTCTTEPSAIYEPSKTEGQPRRLNDATAEEWYDAGNGRWRLHVPAGLKPQPDPSLSRKPSNPKEAVGGTKAPLDLVPDSLSFYAATSFAEGATKYGAYNWRVAGVRASTYKAALERHLKKWWNGQDQDPKTRVKELASVIACAAIILDADLCGKLNDDRPPKAPIMELQEEVEAIFAHLRELHKDLHPMHHTEKNQGT